VEVLQLSARRIVVRFYDTTSGADDYKVEIRIAPVDRLAYEPALSAAHQAIRMRDLALAKRAFSRALMQLPKDDTRQEAEDALYADVMARAVALCEAASFDGAKLLLALARKLEPKSADVAALTRWLGTAAKPMLVEDFRDPKLRKWSAEGGSWRVEDGRLVCLMPSITGNLFLAKARLQDVVLTFDVENGPREVGFRLGAYVRHGLRQHVSFAMSTQFGGLGPGARKGAKGITFTSATKRKIVAESGRRYHVAIRCLGQDIDCYVDDELLARGRDEAPAKGRIGLYAHRADAIFDNVRLYRPMPLPKVSIQTPPAGQ